MTSSSSTTPARDYLVVDLEATCDDLGSIPRHQSEIIEIGAVRVDHRTLRAVDELAVLVRPTIHPRLTPFCTKLTSITQAMVDDAPTFPEAAHQLAAFGAGLRFCSWGDYDRNQLAAEAARHGRPPPLGPDHWNVKRAFAEVARIKPCGMSGALRRARIPLVGTHHRGIDDARNIARLLPFILGRAAC